MSYNFTNCNPIGTLDTKELQELEHKYRLLLKQSGFQDVEAWDNSPRDKIKKVKFIRGHIRYTKNKWDKYRSFLVKGGCKQDYVRIISLYAYHSPKISPKYQDVLQDYSLTGNIAQSIRNTKSIYKVDTIQKYVRYNINKMMKFVKEEFKDDQD